MYSVKTAIAVLTEYDKSEKMQLYADLGMI